MTGYVNNATALVLALATFVSACWMLIQSLRPVAKWTGDYLRGLSQRDSDDDQPEVKPWPSQAAEKNWLPLVLSVSAIGLAVVYVPQIGMYVVPGSEVEEEFEGKVVDCRKISEKRGRYLEAYEDSIVDLQALVMGKVDLGQLLEIKFSETKDASGRHLIMEKDSGFEEDFKSIYEDVVSRQQSILEHDGIPAVLLKSYGDNTGTVHYNRQITLERARKVEALLRESYTPDELDIYLLPLGKSLSTEEDLNKKSVVVQFIRPQLNSQILEDTDAEIEAMVSELDDVDVDVGSEATNGELEVVGSESDLGAAFVDRKIARLKVSVVTGEEDGAWTNASVVLLIGDTAVRIEGDFDKGEEDVELFQFESPMNEQELKKQAIVLSHNNSGFGSGWLVSSIKIETAEAGASDFEIYREWKNVGWLSSKKGSKVTAVVLQSGAEGSEDSGPATLQENSDERS